MGTRSITRRELLGGAGALCVALAGCTGTATDGEDTARTCSTVVVTGGDTGGAIQQASVVVDDRATLRVVVNTDQARSMDHLHVEGTGESYRIPVLDPPPRRTYEQSLRPLPHSGRLRVEARTDDGEALDAIVIDFACRERTVDGG